MTLLQSRLPSIVGVWAEMMANRVGSYVESRFNKHSHVLEL